jgi:hypothetical protein
VCSALEVDVVRDWNLGVTDYWGAVGHYTIATKAVELVGTPGLKQLMQANLDRISFPMEEITKKGTAGLSTKKFVPLADVPDLVWKVGPFKRGGMNSPEHANHFADMDKKDTDGRTLLDICKSPANVTPTVWQRYYDDPKVKDKSHGLLPFRVWQIYQELVGFARKRQYKQFVCAAGILSHYVGDACQPLHISSLFNGDPADSEIVQKRNWRTHKMEDVSVPRAAGVHSAYEDGMVNLHVADIQAALAALRARRSKPINGGYAAAVATVGLMRDTFAAIQPSAIVKAYLPLKVSGQKPQDISDALWAKFGEATIAVMADGARCLAMLWESAWLEGGAPSRVPVTPFRPSELARLYQRESFLPSYTLKTIGAVLDGAPKTTGNGARRAKKKARR